MEWKKVYNTNNDVIDAQHKELVRIVNELENSFARGDSNISQNMSSALTCVKYCIEVKQKFLSDVSFEGLEEQSEIYNKSLKELLDFFTSAEVGARKKVAFIVQWLKDHLITEKDRFAKMVINNIPAEKDVKEKNDNDRQGLVRMCEKLKSLFVKKLINSDDFRENKAKIFTDYLFNRGLENFDAIYGELDEFAESAMISDKEKAEYLARFLKKSGVENALANIHDIDGKLRYLIALQENNLISKEKFAGIKNKILESYLEMSPSEEIASDKENETINAGTSHQDLDEKT